MTRIDFMQRHRTKLFIVLIAAQILFLGGLVSYHYAALWFGQEARLATTPIDPRDLLYGDYVTLNYEISQLDPGLWRGPGNLPEEGDKVYVVLQLAADSDVYQAKALYSRKPAPSGGELIIKGRVRYATNTGIFINYGLEKFYIPENTGKQLEEQTDSLVVKVRIAPWGNAVIEEIEPLTQPR
ncbi:GDYXXLXY domain-containing protein [Paenibacillus sepulcri]|uniref:GDYXXLXY domain-containing protein n=1 Tax=Paenibacillus sepulcri TaxID=359917 RepID=A0ABS7C4T2_9BACL|nr:GDYXXLXY domain-containing protein [Paenibacillus sepulcri]